MVNASGASSQLTPDREEGKSPECPPDNKLPENSQENLDARLDHAIEETFPTSDPVSVTITKGPEPDRSDQEARASSANDQKRRAGQGSTEHVLDQVREALSDIADQASGAARDMYNRGEQYARQAREQYPEAERYIREGHGQQRGRDKHILDYDGTNQGYAPQRDEHRRH
jgi:hypothetical protein